MSQKPSMSVARCDKCQKPLQHTVCSNCAGKGFIQKLLVFKQECDVCEGRGWYLACPDALKHILDDFKASRPIFGQSAFPAGPKTTQQPRFNPVRPKQPPVPPPWLQPNNPMNPNSILNPNNPMNPNSWRNPNNPMNPNSLRNPNNPLNPNNPFHKNTFKK